jgi:hypothetical protein
MHYTCTLCAHLKKMTSTGNGMLIQRATFQLLYNIFSYKKWGQVVYC